jgi:hypothetical protein
MPLYHCRRRLSSIPPQSTRSRSASAPAVVLPLGAGLLPKFIQIKNGYRCKANGKRRGNCEQKRDLDFGDLDNGGTFVRCKEWRLNGRRVKQAS